MCGYSIFIGESLRFNEFKSKYKQSNIIQRGGNGDNFYSPKAGYYCGHSLFHVTAKKPVFQPIKTKDGLLLFNGEIYNFRELAENNGWLDLDSDTLLLVKLIDKYGVHEALSIIYGATSITFCDLKKGLVYLFRDGWGQKPLYYSTEDNELVVSSSFKFLESIKDKKRNADNKTLYEMFGFSPFGFTINPKIYSVIPGNLVCIDTREQPKIIEIKQITSKTNDASFNWVETLKYRLLQNFPSVPAAIAFSGGVDSSILAKLSYDLDNKLPLFHLDIKSNELERKNALFVSDALNAKLVSCDVDQAKLIEMRKNEIFDHPVENLGITSTALLAMEAREQGIRVMLTGMGADEYFGGYARADIMTKLKGMKTSTPWFKVMGNSFKIGFKFRILLSLIFLISSDLETRVILGWLLFRSNRYRKILFKNLFRAKPLFHRLQVTLPKINKINDFGEALILFERHYVMPEYMCLPLDTVAQRLNIEMRSPFLFPELDTIFNQKTGHVFISGKKLLKEYLSESMGYFSDKKERFQL